MRNEFFNMLIGAVIVGAMRQRGREAVRMSPGADKMVGSGFRGGIRGIGSVRGLLIEKAVVKRAVDFIGGDVMEMEMGHLANDFEQE